MGNGLDELITVLLPTRLCAGDIICSSSNTVSGAAIEWITGGNRSHAALVIDPPSTLFQAMDGVRGLFGAVFFKPTGALEVVRTLNHQYPSQWHVQVLRLRSPAPRDRARDAAGAANTTGSAYYAPWLALAGVLYNYRDRCAFAKIVAESIVVGHRKRSTTSAYCSHIIAAAYERAGTAISDKPAEFVLPKDIRAGNTLEVVDDCTRQIRRSWLPAVPDAPLAAYHRVLRGIVQDPRGTKALESFWRNRRIPKTKARSMAKDPCQALHALFEGHPGEEISELDDVAYEQMQLCNYRGRLLSGAAHVAAPYPSDDEWREEVRAAEEQRFDYELKGARETRDDLDVRLNIFPKSHSLLHMRDAYADLIRQMSP